MSASEDRITVRLPSDPTSLGLVLRAGEMTSPVFPFALASQLAGGIHAVTSPVIAPDGSVVTTFSGSRGEQDPQPIVRITRAGEKTAFACDIVNPTGLAFGPDGQLYVSSRNDGTIYRFRDFEEMEPVVDDLGDGAARVGDAPQLAIRSASFDGADQQGHQCFEEEARRTGDSRQQKTNPG